MATIRKQQAANSNSTTMYNSRPAPSHQGILWSKINENASNTGKNSNIIRPSGKMGRVMKLKCECESPLQWNSTTTHTIFVSTSKNKPDGNTRDGVAPPNLDDNQCITPGTLETDKSNVHGQKLIFIMRTSSGTPDVQIHILNGGYMYKKGDRIVINPNNFNGGSQAYIIFTVLEIN
jgi:hypothetical protein